MRPADMARAIFLTLIFLTLASTRPAPSRWEWYPVNTNLASGFQFHFQNPPDGRAKITISGTRDREPFTVTKTIGTNAERSEDHCFFTFDIRNLDKLKLTSIRMEMAGRVQTVDDPRAGTEYRF